jgi:cytochrome b
MKEMHAMKKILVWDVPTRLGHWLLVASFAIAWLTSESETWKDVHVAAGSLMVAVVLFRLLWGAVGSRYARFGSFTFSPAAALDYLTGLLRRRPAHYTGHNPAGSYAIYLLLALTLLAGLTGWLAYNELGGEEIGEVHEFIAGTMLGLVVLHLVGVVVGGLAHGENLALSMVTGRKLGEPGEAIDRARWGWALLLGAWAGAAVWLSRYL